MQHCSLKILVSTTVAMCCYSFHCLASHVAIWLLYSYNYTVAKQLPSQIHLKTFSQLHVANQLVTIFKRNGRCILQALISHNHVIQTTVQLASYSYNCHGNSYNSQLCLEAMFILELSQIVKFLPYNTKICDKINYTYTLNTKFQPSYLLDINITILE